MDAQLAAVGEAHREGNAGALRNPPQNGFENGSHGPGFYPARDFREVSISPSRCSGGTHGSPTAA